jgi:hypothetical protein
VTRAAGAGWCLVASTPGRLEVTGKFPSCCLWLTVDSSSRPRERAIGLERITDWSEAAGTGILTRGRHVTCQIVPGKPSRKQSIVPNSYSKGIGRQFTCPTHSRSLVGVRYFMLVSAPSSATQIQFVLSTVQLFWKQYFYFLRKISSFFFRKI